MSKRRFVIVDVFAEKKYAGNQLAVIRDCAGLSSEQMQEIALEMNYSETTFILSETERNGGYDVRIFTPNAEVPFAGHPTLGTAAVIQSQIAPDRPDRVVLNLQVGPIPVQVDGEMLWMRQNEPDFGEILAPDLLAGVLGLKTADVDTSYPVQDVSTGLPFIICPLRSLDAVRSARVNYQQLVDMARNTRAQAILVFSRESRNREDDLSVRVFADLLGVAEDPATGSANGCLAGYLARHRYFGGPSVAVRAGQGHEINRPSALYLRAEDQNGQVQVRVGGKVVPVAEGVLV